MMKYRFENWHIIVVALLLFFIYKAGLFGFMGALSGICTSQEPVAQADIVGGMRGWVIGTNATLSADGASWTGAYIKVVDVNSINASLTCQDVLNSLLATVLSQENATSTSFFEGPRRVVKFNNFVVGTEHYSTLFSWCGPTSNILIQTNAEAAERLYFDNYFTCKQCVAGTSENKTCPAGNSILWRTCDETGIWKTVENCPAPITQPVAPQTCPAGQYWDNILNKCTSGVQCLATEHYDSAARGCKENVVVQADTTKTASTASWIRTNVWLVASLALIVICVGFLLYKKYA